jgi:hypothetical protein
VVYVQRVPEHEPGLVLSEGFYREVVAGLLADHQHGAALLGWGSEVLGFDTQRSTDHGWGPRLIIFVDAGVADEVRRMLDQRLPESFRGWPVRYGWDAVPVGHHVVVTALRSWCAGQFGLVPSDGLNALDWLLIPQQKLLEATRGAVYADPTGALEALREQLAWYPEQVWRWLIACQWRRIAQEEAFPGRAAEVGDRLGSQLLAARLVREVMRLAFLLARRYWPYGKWFGRAFADLPDTDGLGALLAETVSAAEHRGQERTLARAYLLVAARCNAAGLFPPVDPSTRPYYDRPFTVLMADRFADACRATVTDPSLAALPLIGSIDQALDSTDLLERPAHLARLRALYVPGNSSLSARDTKA